MTTPKILIIEDDPALIGLYKRVMNRADYDVYTAMTLKQAQDLLAEHQFDLVLADMELGGERTITLLREVAQVLQEGGTNIVGVSANDLYRSLCEEAGVEFFLTKPVSVNTLVRLTDRITVGQMNRKVPLILDTTEMMRYVDPDAQE
jgi:CheY-like chemotaxis protein